MNIAQVKTLTLDALVQEFGWFRSKQEIVLLKMDVEGYEPAVVRGAQKLFQSGLV